MPIYEYECEQCKTTDEKLILTKKQKEQSVKCKKCGKKMKQIISRSSFHLKGTGWYVTDYKNKDKPKPKKPKIDTKLKETK